MAASFISARRKSRQAGFWLLLCLLMAAPMALGCSFAFTGMPYQADHFVFHGKVKGYTTLRMEACGRDPRRSGDQCPPAWGWRLEVIEPVHLPKPVTEVEYFELTVDAACGAMPLNETHVRRMSVGSLVTVIASAAPSWLPVGSLPRLSGVLPAHGLLAAMPEGSQPSVLRREEIDRRLMACVPERRWPDARVAFEYWRDRQALDAEKSQRRRLERLLRMMSVFDERYFQRSGQPNMHEKVVGEYLTTPELLEEFYARLPAERVRAHAACVSQ